MFFRFKSLDHLLYQEDQRSEQWDPIFFVCEASELWFFDSFGESELFMP